MNLFSTLADYKHAVITTCYRNAQLYDITLFKSHGDALKFIRENAREMQKTNDELVIGENGCSVIVSDEEGKYMRWTIDLTKNLLMRVSTYNN